MSPRQLAGILLIEWVIVVPNQAYSQEPQTHIYTVTIRGSSNFDKPTVQTGFRLKGVKGIITALHGVVNGSEFSALNEDNSFDTLRIASVDIERDAALLVSEVLLQREAEGLKRGDVVGLRPRDTLHVWGFPHGIQLHDKSVNTGNPVMRSLRSLIGTDVAVAFATRNSPAMKITVVDIEGQLGPGHSGAPVIDGHQTVVGVVDGGLASLGINWAIPINTIEWTDVASRHSQLEKLARTNPRDLFDYQPEIERAVKYGNVAIRFLAGERNLKGLGVHLGVERSVLLADTRFAVGLEGAYLGHDNVTEYSTLPGYTSSQVHEYFWTPAISGVIRWFPWKAISLDPSIAVLGGYPFNLQVSVSANILYFAPLQVKAEVRGVYFTAHKKVIEFNPFGDSTSIIADEKMLRAVIGVAITFGV